MSDIKSEQRKEMLRHLLLRLHEGDNPDVLRKQLIDVLRNIPYHEVVEVEQELISSNSLTEAEILEFCDLHTAVLDGSIDLEDAKPVPPGHPVDTFIQENKAINAEVEKYFDLEYKVRSIKDDEVEQSVIGFRTIFNNLSDIEKHYLRKEYLLFPYLEQNGITGPPVVMWGKHDETREYLKAAHEALAAPIASAEELRAVAQLSLTPTVNLIEGMIMKEEEILLPMSMDTLKEEDWYKIYRETPEFGCCLYDPQVEWRPAGSEAAGHEFVQGDAIRLSTGAFNYEELEALFVHLPLDITFVDKNDKVRFFSHSPKRVFARNRSVIGRDVRMCHPPGSVHIVEQIMADFRSGKENKAVFWMSNFQGRFIYIEYSAVRGNDGEYLGVVEFTQDITEMRKLEGDQRLLSYEQK